MREYVVGYDDRAERRNSCKQMQDLVRQAMREGALGVGSSLIYAPASYAKTDEPTRSARPPASSAAATSRTCATRRSLPREALDELIRISREAKVHAQAYHLKAAGQKNWPKMAQAIAKIEAGAQRRPADHRRHVCVHGRRDRSRRSDAAVGTAGRASTAGSQQLKKPDVARKSSPRCAIPTRSGKVCCLRPAPDRVLLIGFKTDKLKPLTGKTLAEVAKMRGVSPEDAAIDLVIEDHTRVGTAYFLMSEENVRLGLSQPWVNIGSDAEAAGARGPVPPVQQSASARLWYLRPTLGQYVREQKVTTLQDAIRRLTRLPADNFKLKDRGCLDQGCFADIAVFDPAKINDLATFDTPHQYATGVSHVLVNGGRCSRTVSTRARVPAAWSAARAGTADHRLAPAQRPSGSGRRLRMRLVLVT